MTRMDKVYAALFQFVMFGRSKVMFMTSGVSLIHNHHTYLVFASTMRWPLLHLPPSTATAGRTHILIPNVMHSPQEHLQLCAAVDL